MLNYEIKLLCIMIIDVVYVRFFNVIEFVIIDLVLFESGLKIIFNVC